MKTKNALYKALRPLSVGAAFMAAACSLPPVESFIPHDAAVVQGADGVYRYAGTDKPVEVTGNDYCALAGVGPLVDNATYLGVGAVSSLPDRNSLVGGMQPIVMGAAEIKIRNNGYGSKARQLCAQQRAYQLWENKP